MSQKQSSIVHEWILSRLWWTFWTLVTDWVAMSTPTLSFFFQVDMGASFLQANLATQTEWEPGTGGQSWFLANSFLTVRTLWLGNRAQAEAQPVLCWFEDRFWRTGGESLTQNSQRTKIGNFLSTYPLRHVTSHSQRSRCTENII